VLLHTKVSRTQCLRVSQLVEETSHMEQMEANQTLRCVVLLRIVAVSIQQGRLSVV
jgi:hypothetical protein